MDRLRDIKRVFHSVLVIGAQGNIVADQLRKIPGYTDTDITVMDLDHGLGADVIGDEEFLPFAANSFDCVIVNLGLSCVNDLPGALAQIRYSLQPDGVFLATIFGTQTLEHFRASLMEAELTLYDAAVNRVAPFVDIVDAAALMQRVQYALPVVDQDIITVSYPDIYRLMRDLRGMGLATPLEERHSIHISRTLFDTADDIYKKRYGDRDGRLNVPFEIVTMTGWAPDASQQQPLRPGSAQTPLAEALDSKEHSLPEISNPDKGE